MSKFPLALMAGDELYFTFEDIGVKANIKPNHAITFANAAHVYEYITSHPECVTPEHELLWHMHLAARKADAEAHERKRAEDSQAQNQKATNPAWLVLVGDPGYRLFTIGHLGHMCDQGRLIRCYRGKIWSKRPYPDAGGVPEQREG